MKKSLLILFSAFCINGFSQSSLQLKDVASALIIAPNSVIMASTAANLTTAYEFDVKNTSAAAKLYRVKRYDLVLHTVAASSTTADAHFCFAGSCYGSNILLSPTSLSLNAGQSATEMQGTFNTLTIDLDEASTAGYSLVKYTVFNTATTSDSLQFTVIYNSPNGISETNINALSSFEIFPNPATDLTVVKVNSQKAMDAKVIIYNALGAIVSEKAIGILEGKNKIEVNISDLSSGVYLAQIKMANSSVTKKLIVK